MAYHPMTDDEARDFMGGHPARPGILATTRKDGRPHVAPGWAAMTVDDDQPPFSFVTVEEPVTISDDLGEVRAGAARIGGRYMGADRAEEYGERNGVPGELLVRLTPTKFVSARDLAD